MHNGAEGFTNSDEAGEGGALYFAAGSQGTLETDAITSNTATGSAAGFPRLLASAQGGGLFATGANLTINLSTVSNNLATAGPGGTDESGGTAEGGGLYLQGGTVALTQSTIAGNAAQGGRGGRPIDGDVTVGGEGLGGGLCVSNGSNATITITGDTFFQNTATGGHGGLGGSRTAGGRGGGGEGGAVAVGDLLSGAPGVTVNMTNDTIAANVAEGGDGGTGGGGPAHHGGAGGIGGGAAGGGISANGGAITLLNDTIAGSSRFAAKPTKGNSAVPASGGFASGGKGAQALGGIAQGGGLFDSGGTGGTPIFMTLQNTIVANNSFHHDLKPDVSGFFIAQDHNLIGDAFGGYGFGGSDLTGVDPHLAALAFNGGRTQTMLLIAGPAIDAADDNVAPLTDQRGITRPQGTAADIGAVEDVNLTFAIVSGNNQTAKRGTEFKPLVVELTENGNPIAGVIISFNVVGLGTGGGGKLNHAHVTTNSKGQASVTLTANSKTGVFSVGALLARVAGASPVLRFTLRNS